MSYQYRDWQKRIIFQDACYFVTLYTKNRFNYFKEKIFCDLFVENLKLCKRLKGFLLYGWVVIYEHVHIQIQPGDKFNISGIMHFLKRHVSRNINIIMGYTKQYSSTPESADGHPHFLGVGDSRQSDIGQCRFQDGVGSSHHQSVVSSSYLQDWYNPSHIQDATNPNSPSYLQGLEWILIRQFDLYVYFLKNQFQQKYPNGHPFPKFHWQKSFIDHYTRNENDFDEHMEYIANNPNKHGLPDDWPYVFTNPKHDDLIDDF